MTHPEMSSLGLRQLADEVDKMYTLTLPDGSIPLRNRLFRPPKGVVTLPLVWHCARKGIQLVFWNRDPEDYKAQGSYEILDYFKADLPQSGDIILLHDKTTHIVAALPQLLAQLRNLGLKPVTVSELLA